MLKGDVTLQARFERLRRAWDREDTVLAQDLEARLRRFTHRGMVHPATVLTTLHLAAVFGRGNLANHVTLAVLLLIWLFGDEVTDLLSSQNGRESAANVRPSWWLYTLPAANMLAGWWLLREQQHEPRITGTAVDFERRSTGLGELPAALARPGQKELGPRPRTRRYIEEYSAVVDLVPLVAPEFELDLRGLGDLPAHASVSALTWSSVGARRGPRVESLAVQVEAGQLHLRIVVSARRAKRDVPLVAHVRVAWLVEVLSEAKLSRTI